MPTVTISASRSRENETMLPELLLDPPLQRVERRLALLLDLNLDPVSC